MKDFLPAIHKNFVKENINLQVFVMDWFLTLFAKSFPIDIAARLWDMYFLDGEVQYLI